MITIRSLRDTPPAQLYLAFSEAFRDYITTWSAEAFHRMLERRGYEPGLSFGAFDGDHLVSFTYNGVGEFRGLQTAYDTGTGTLPEYRGQGLATLIFTESIPHLKSHGIAQYLLEVLQDNEAAVTIYARQGFEITRAFNVFRVINADWTAPDMGISGLRIREIDFSQQPAMEAMWDFYPSWQNSFSSLAKNPEHFITIGAFREDTFMGYAVLEPSSGDIPQLAVHKHNRRQGIGTMLLHALRQYNEAQVTRVVNTDTAYEEMTQFLLKNGIPLMARQFEMIKML